MSKNEIAQHQFVKGFDPRRNTKGAPRKLISTISELGYSNRQVSDTMLNLLAMSESELEIVCNDENFSILERMVAKALLKDFSKGSLWNIETLLSRSVGKPKETTNIQNERIDVVFVNGKTIL